MLEVGMKAPELDFNVTGKGVVKLPDFKGKKVVLYFYPKDNTSGCTQEACSFRDYHDEILARGAVIIGVSPDSDESHQRFREKHNLPFYLVSDTDHELATAFGAWSSGKMHRSTFIIDEAGEIIKVFTKVNTAQHGKEVLEFLEGL